MRILRVIPSMNPAKGGPPQGLRNLIPSINELNVLNEVACLDDPGEDFGRHDPFAIHRVGKGSSSWRYNKKLPKWLDENLEAFDAVVIHGIWQYHSFAVSRAVSRLRNKCVSSKMRAFVMPHGMLDPWFQRDPTRRFKALRNRVYWRLIEKHTISQADGVLFTCQRELELANEAFTQYAPKLELNVGYGVDQPPVVSNSMRESFRSACPSIQETPYLLFLSRIHPKKGIDLLIKAYGNIAKQVGEATLPHLVIAGPLDSEYAESMLTLAKSHGLSRIVFPGMLHGDAKWGAFYGCDAFILPSHQENFGIAVVEATACGKPVLISNQINIFKEIEEDGAALVCDDTLQGVEAMLSKWLKMSADTRRQMGERASESYRSRYLPCNAALQFTNSLFSENALRVAKAS